jgi:hypothetical protein
LRACPDPIESAELPDPVDQDALRAAIKLVLSSPEAVAEVIGGAPGTAFNRHTPLGRARHDGWTGERMATFLEVLADTGLITEACRSAGMSRDAVYSLRNRDPLFDAALRAAQTKARPQVADGILERSINGTVEHYYRDGVLVGERRHYESWLALAVLKRLDKQAEDDVAENGLTARIATNWNEVIDALREGGISAVPGALDAKTYKAYIPPPPGLSLDPDESIWRTDENVWMTSFPPPPEFDGEENCPFDGFNYYERTCTAEEAALLDARVEATEADDRAKEDAQRDKYFAKIRSELSANRATE